MRSSNVRLILLREIRDQLRDRRTLFTIAILPLILYPLLGMVFLQVAQFTRQYPARIWVIGAEELPDNPALIENTPEPRFVVEFCAGEDEAKLLELTLASKENTQGNRIELLNRAKEAVQKGGYDAVILFPPTFSAQLDQFRAARGKQKFPPDSDVETPDAEILYDAARDESLIAHDRVHGVLKRWRNMLGRKNLRENRIPAAAASPFDVVPQNVAIAERQRAAVWSKILPFLALIWALTGAFYPAIDLCAGEKERGTLETLLSSPASRTEIVWGKLLTVMIFSIATAILNLFSMGLTAALILGQMEPLAAALPELPMGPPPLVATGWLIAALIPISALFSALSMALAALARSAKEGQYYLMPLLLITMPLMLLPMLPSIQLDLGTSLIPVTGMLLLLRDLMEAEYATALKHVIPVVGITAICCLLAIRWAVDQFNNESVLFRESERLDIVLWLRHLVRDRGELPTVAEGMFCGVMVLVIRFFANFQFDAPQNWNQLAKLTLVTQIAFFATPALIMAIILTRSPRKSLLLTVPAWKTVPLAVLLAVALHPVAMAVSHLVLELYPISGDMTHELAKLLNDAPNVLWLLLVLAITPAICEELTFRGFILSGLVSSGQKWRAIVLSSLFFGVAHGILQQSITASLVGIVIGYLAVQTGSLLPCVLYHATHNSLAILASGIDQKIVDKIPANEWFLSSTDAGFVYTWPVILVGAFVSVVLLQWLRRLPGQSSEMTRAVGTNCFASEKSIM